jgi:uncharacterized YigZ family protein
MRVPLGQSSFEQIIKGSRFLSESFPVSSQQEVREILKSQKQKYADATHVCHAFICGKKAEIMGMSDDGEPGGTAGRPMLDILKGSGCTNILITVTRWFGGTLLGTGGLVHAYGDGARGVLGSTETEELVEKREFEILCDYQQYNVVKKALEEFTVSAMSEEFGENVRLNAAVSLSEFPRLASSVFDRTNGKVAATPLGE